MPYDTPLIRRVLSLATVALFFFGVIGAFAVDREPDETDLAGRDADDILAPDTSAVPGGAGDPGGVTDGSALPGDGPAAPGPGAERPTQTTAGGSGPAAPSCPYAPAGPVKPPPAGVYRYDKKTTEDGETTESTTDDKYAAPCTESGVTRQQVTLREDQATFVHTVAWTADAVRLEATRIESPFGAFDCDWTPDSTEVALPLSQGASWKIDSSCESDVQYQGQTFRTTARRSGEVRVTGQRQVDVGGTAVRVFVLEGNFVLEASAGGQNSRQETVTVSHFAPDHGLRVYTKDTITSTALGGRKTATHEKTLTSLRPR